ncbi:MAG TPA: hypothetical protein VE974_01760 [Thermoanaerobaculia bacterium]|nr:hypothetical protein [Thermoanaerobaculia bacterium]
MAAQRLTAADEPLVAKPGGRAAVHDRLYASMHAVLRERQLA